MERSGDLSMSIVVATCMNGTVLNGIGLNGTLPWKLPADMRFFRELTTATQDPSKHNAVIMGRKTWQSIPEKFKPLPHRINVVLSQSLEDERIIVCKTLDTALLALSTDPSIEQVFVIGGASVYEEALNHEMCECIYQTVIHHPFECDTFFPATTGYQEIYSSDLMEDNGLHYRFTILAREK